MKAKKASPAKALYKVLVDGCSVHGGDLTWSLPNGAKPGEWHEVEGEIEPCRTGLHLTNDPARWWRDSAEVYLVETAGKLVPVAHDDKVVASKARLVRRLTWAELAEFGITIDAQFPRAPAKGLKQKPPPAKGPSPAMQFVRCAWENRCEATAHSWRTVNDTMSSALMLAVTGGMSFAKGDLEEIHRAMRGAYWFGESGEGFYKAACEVGNIQACQSFEAWTGRKPFMWEGHRLSIRSQFTWEGQEVVVTSFQDTAGALIACSYKPSAGHNRGPIDRRYTITAEMLSKAEKDRKVEKAITKDVGALQDLLQKCNLKVLDATMAAWTPEERTAAAEWAQFAQHDAGKKRVRPAPPPECLAAAVASYEKDRSEAEKRERAHRIRRYREEIAQYQKWLAQAEKNGSDDA